MADGLQVRHIHLIYPFIITSLNIVCTYVKYYNIILRLLTHISGRSYSTLQLDI